MHAAAQGLADSLTPGELERNLLYPDIERVSRVRGDLLFTLSKGRQD